MLDNDDARIFQLLIQWTDPLSVTVHWKAVEQYFTVVPFVFRFSPVCNFGKFVIFGLDTVRSEGVKCLFLIPKCHVYFTCPVRFRLWLFLFLSVGPTYKKKTVCCVGEKVKH